MVNWSTYSLAALGVVAASPLYELEKALNTIFQETDDGFIVNMLPHYHLIASFDDSSAIFNEKFTLLGDELHTMDSVVAWSDSDASLVSVAKGKLANVGSQAWDIIEFIGQPSCRYAPNEDYTVTFQLKAEFGATGLTQELSYNVDLDNVNGFQLEQLFNLDFTLGSEVVVDTEFGFEWLDKTGDFYFMSSVDTISLASQITLPQEKCGVYFSSGMKKGSCPLTCSLEGAIDVESIDLTSSVTFKRAMIAFESNYNGDIANVVLRSESPEGVVELLTAKRFFAIYFSTSTKYLNEIRKGKAFLVLRFPGINTATTVLLPELMLKAEPFIEFGGALLENYEYIPNLVYYFDLFAATFDDEFDFSNFVKLTKIESDIFGSSLNEFLQSECIAFNQMVMDEFFHHPDVPLVYEDIRDYVTYLNDADKGQSDYETTFGGIF